MKKIEGIKDILSKFKPIVQEKYKVTELGIFGSYVRGEQNDASDVDILIDFEQTSSLLKLLELENYLSDTLGLKVYLVMKRVLKPSIGTNIFSEVIYV